MARSERLYHALRVPRQDRRATLLAIVTVFTLLLLGYYQLSVRGLHPPLGLGEESCLPQVMLLKQYSLSPTIDYARLRVAVEFSNKEVAFAEELAQPLPDFEPLDLAGSDPRKPEDSSSSGPSPHCPASLRLRVPKRASADASHILFGVATTLERLEATVDAMAHWLGHSNARLLAVIPSAPGVPVLAEKMADAGIDVTIVESDDEFNDRYFGLVKLTYDRRKSSTRWVGIIDDDTFFLSMPALVSRLDTYDAKKLWYIGGLSEDFQQLVLWGYMAYGGAGVFLSVPLLAQLNQVFDECKKSGLTGDRRLARCIYQHTTTKLTWEVDLHQVDLHGDPSGLYEAGRRQPLSIHHWKEWYPINVTAMSTVSSVCGEACILKQWRFSNGWFLNNGYSVVKYSAERSVNDAMEQTWDDFETSTVEPYMFALGPLLPKDESKVSLRLEHVIHKDGLVRQFYIRRTRDGHNDQVLEVIWTSH